MPEKISHSPITLPVDFRKSLSSVRFESDDGFGEDLHLALDGSLSLFINPVRGEIHFERELFD